MEENVYHIQGLKNGYHILKIENVSENGRTINFGGIDISRSQEDVVNNGRLTACEKGTGADYIKKCENTGYDIICARKKLPEYLTDMGYVIHNAINVLLISDNADERGVKKYAKSVERVAGYALCDTEFWVELTIPGAVKKISFYSVDYDYLGREMEVCVEDADTGRVLCTKEIKEFQEGVLLTFELRGHIFVRYRNVKGPDAVLNAVWFW